MHASKHVYAQWTKAPLVLVGPAAPPADYRPECGLRTCVAGLVLSGLTLADDFMYISREQAERSTESAQTRRTAEVGE